MKFSFPCHASPHALSRSSCKAYINKLNAHLPSYFTCISDNTIKKRCSFLNVTFQEEQE